MRIQFKILICWLDFCCKPNNPKPVTMKKSYVMFLLISGIIAFLVNCSKEPAYREYLIKVDSLTVQDPQIAGTGESFTVHLYGLISPDGCSSFSRFKSYWKNQDLIIEAWKNVKVNATVCPTVLVFLDQDLSLNRASLPDKFVLKVKQPDGSYLEKPININ
jgi:hypothetical protein